jgi:hypothetical protein
MKILISESQYNQLLLEAAADKAVNVLVSKYGLDKEIAQDIAAICGNLTLILFNKVFNFDVSRLSSGAPSDQKKKIIIEFYNMNQNNFYRGFNGRDNLVSIMDWIRVGLNGNFKPYMDQSIIELIRNSYEWHQSLNIGSDVIDYKEDKKIIIDYRDDKGLGLYWVSLGVKTCDKESARMGHCGSSSGYLFSLREYKAAPNGHTFNKSLLTASINKDIDEKTMKAGPKYGMLLQLKGPKNSKPDPKYFKYIKDLLEYKDPGSNQYLVKSFGSEYDSKNDFKLSDLDDKEYAMFYKIRPELFNNYSDWKRLDALGLKKWEGFGKQDVDIWYGNIATYVNFGNGNIGRENESFYMKTLSGQTPMTLTKMWNSQIMTSTAEKTIIKILLKRMNSNATDIRSQDVVTYINEYAQDIRAAYTNAKSAIFNLDFYNYIKEGIKEALSVYGEVITFGSHGTSDHLTLRVDLDKFIEFIGFDDSEIKEFIEYTKYKLEQFFYELVIHVLHSPQNDRKWKLKSATEFKFKKEYDHYHMNDMFMEYFENEIKKIKP